MQKQMKEVEEYIKKYNEKVTTSNAQQAVDDFITNYDNWKKIVGYMVEGKDGEREYGTVLIIFSVAISEVNSITETNIDILVSELKEYEQKVKYLFEIKSALYCNLGICWHKLGLVHNKTAIEAFKQHLFYQFTLSNHTSYRELTCYSFRNCSKFLFQSLANSTLNLSSPKVFNDIFDCPVMELMNNDDDISKLVREAYLSGVKVACFVKNEKLPYMNDSQDDLIRDDKKNENDKKEYLNELMWAHYADSHRGICIKYKFPSDITTSAGENSNYVSYFKDVEYSSDLEKFSKQKSINMKDAFFAKGTSWKYENELRLLYYNPTDNNSFVSLPILNCIEAVYFGVKCPDQDKQAIREILKNRKCVSYKEQRIDGVMKKIKNEKDIEFYQMNMDDKVFGTIKEVKI